MSSFSYTRLRTIETQHISSTKTRKKTKTLTPEALLSGGHLGFDSHAYI